MSGTLASYLILCKTLSGTEASILNYMEDHVWDARVVLDYEHLYHF
ncbi:hypothetical protein F383_17273 [Gossypium arboreum]|uniref:Uncharacterized protein n=1 Tax=Gossypium arboreum TaxID=29729 RepID=A0A0B0NP30_GOSAR|nr:hypothetical protein F383_17273 [Gossypium arboreum]